jgi:hypothetical protein
MPDSDPILVRDGGSPDDVELEKLFKLRRAAKCVEIVRKANAVISIESALATLRRKI